MCRVDSASNIEINIGRFFKQQTTDERCAITLLTPNIIFCVFGKMILGIFKYSVNCYYTFRYQINALKLCDWRNVGTFKLQAGLQRLTKILGCD